MNKFLKLTYGDKPILVNVDHIQTIYPRTPNDPKSPCVIELSGDMVTVDETFRMLKGRIFKLYDDTNPDTNTNNEEDN